MKKKVALWLSLVMAVSIFTACGGGGETNKEADSANTAQESPKQNEDAGAEAAPAADGDITIAVICKAMDSEFWMDVKKGAEDAAAELGVSVDVKAPDKESNVEQQFKIVEDAILQKYSVIAIAPNDSAGIVPILEDAVAKGVKIMTIDTDADTDARMAFVGTNNKMGGEMGAKRMIELFKDKPGAKVALITGVPGQQTMRDRADGFKEALAGSDINLVDEQPADSDPGKAMAVMENYLTSYPDLDGVFILNATMSVSSLEAINNASSAVKVIGFDSSTDALQAIKDGKMDSLVAQSPYNMGKYAVENAFKAAKGETIETVIDTGTDLVTADNVGDYLK